MKQLNFTHTYAHHLGNGSSEDIQFKETLRMVEKSNTMQICADHKNDKLFNPENRERKQTSKSYAEIQAKRIDKKSKNRTRNPN